MFFYRSVNMTECFVDVIAEKTDTQSAKTDTEN